MNPLLAILACGALFALLGVLTREREPDLRLEPGEPCAPADTCGSCAHPCASSESSHVPE